MNPCANNVAVKEEITEWQAEEYNDEGELVNFVETVQHADGTVEVSNKTVQEYARFYRKRIKIINFSWEIAVENRREL